MGRIVKLARNVEVRECPDAQTTIQWSAQRHPALPVLEARGEIWRWRPSGPGRAGGGERSAYAGTVGVAKPYLWSDGDVFEAMASVGAGCRALAVQVLGSAGYREDFAEWMANRFGVVFPGDPVFVHDIRIEPGHRSPRRPLAAVAALEAAQAFGSRSSPIIGFAPVLVREEQRARRRDEGLWDWIEPLGAKPWRDLVVAVPTK